MILGLIAYFHISCSKLLTLRVQGDSQCRCIGDDCRIDKNDGYNRAAVCLLFVLTGKQFRTLHTEPAVVSQTHISGRVGELI